MSSAGLRAAQMIQPVIIALSMLPATQTVSVPLRQRLDSSRRLQPDSVMETAATALLDELHHLTRACETLRMPAQAQALR
jgi:hypothetical protein